MHGAKAPKAAAKSAAAKAERQARWVAERHAVPIEVNAVDAVLAEMARCNGLINFYQRKVDELDDKAMVFGVAKVVDQRSGQGRAGRDTTFEPRVNTWIALRDAERDRLRSLAIDAARVDLDTKRLRLDAARHGLIVRNLDGLLAGLGHDPHDSKVAAVVVTWIEQLPGSL
jgi:hypothetical protein